MTYNLGRAQFILEADGDDLLRETARTYNEVTKQAQALTKTLAKEEQVRQSDVRNAASVIISERKKQAAEEAKLEAKTAAERKKLIIDGIKNDVAVERQNAANRKARARSIISEEKAIERERLNAVRTTERELTRIRQQGAQQRAAAERQESRQKSTSGSALGNLGLGNNLGGTAATLLGFGAIASSAVILREAIVGLTDATLKQDQAQRSLNAAFGESAASFQKAADANAKQFERVNSEVQQGTAYFGILQKQYGVTTAEIEKLIKVSIELQSAYGGELVQVFRDVSNAIQGEPQALEKYGIALQQNAVKGSRLLTEEQKKLYETMTVTEQSRIRLTLLFDAAAKTEGAAAQRARDAAGGFDAFNRSVNNLSVTLGKAFTQEASNAARAISGLLNGIDDFIKRQGEFDKALADLRADQQNNPFSSGGIGPIFAPFNFDQQELVRERVLLNRRREAEKEAAKEREQARIKETTDLQAAENARVDSENSRIKRLGGIVEEELKIAAERYQRLLDNEIKLQERLKDAQLDKLEETHKAELRALEATEEARQTAAELELAQIQATKDAKLDAIEATRDSALAALDAEKDAVVSAADEQIRQAEIARDKRAQLNEDTRDEGLRRLEDEERARDKARIDEDNAIEDSVTKQQRTLDAAHRVNVRRFEREGEEFRRNYDKRQDAIDDLQSKEDERHRKTMENIDDEATEALDKIDERIAAIKRLQEASDNARRNADLQSRVNDNRLALTRAQGTGTPEQLNDARSKLTAAIRIGDPEAVRKAQAELLEIAGQGNEAIAKAQKELFDSEEDLRQESIKQSGDAEIEKLEQSKTRVRRQADEEKRDEEERNRRRKRSLDDDKKASKQRLDDALEKLEERQEKEEDAYKEDKQRLTDSIEDNKRTLESIRRAQDEKAEDDQRRIRDVYEAEQDAIKDTYESEDKGIIPAIRRAVKFAQEQYEERTKTIQATYKAERAEVEATFDHPVTGIIATHVRAEKAARTAYENTKQAVIDNYGKAKKVIEDFYSNSEGTGVIDRLKNQKTETERALRDDLTEWEKWEKGLTGPEGIITRTFKDAQDRFDQFIRHIGTRGGVTIQPRTITSAPTGTNPGEGDTQGQISGGGGAAAPAITIPPPVSGNTGRPPESMPSSGSGEVDVSPGRFATSFGYAQPYSDNFTPGPGWEGGAAWPGGPSHHKGIDLIIPGAKNNGRGLPVGSFTNGRIVQTQTDDKGPGGKYVVVEGAGGKTFWYMHLDSVNRSSGPVNRGDIIGVLGGTGTENFPHLHFEVRQGLNNGPSSLRELREKGIDPRPFMSGYDKGTLFKNPTMTFDMVTGKQGVLAEKAPERLLGSEDTKHFDRFKPTGPHIGSYTPAANDYSLVGSMLASTPTINQIENKGDVFNYDGVAPESIIKRWRDDQRRQRVLRGVRR